MEHFGTKLSHFNFSIFPIEIHTFFHHQDGGIKTNETFLGKIGPIFHLVYFNVF